MADDLDVEAMLEAPYKKEDEGGRNNNGDGHKDKDKDRRKRSRSKDRDRKSKSGRDKRRSRSRDKKRSRSRSRSRDKRRDRDRRRSRSRSRDRKRRSRSRDRGRRGGRARSDSPNVQVIGGVTFETLHRERQTDPDLSPEERDARTVFCMQLSARIRPRDLEEFFSSIGKVKDVRIITDNKTRRSKGIAYVEFQELESVPLAIGLSGERLLGVPIIVQASQAEKNRLANSTSSVQKGLSGPMRLYVGSLHFNITEDMLRGIFEPFGKIDEVKLISNHDSGRSQGYGFVTETSKNYSLDNSTLITFHNSEDAKKALEQLNGFELAGRPMKVGHVTERTADNQGTSILDSDEMDRAGIDLGATGRLQLMAKLAEGTGFQIPDAAANALNMAPGVGTPAPATAAQPPATSTPPIATQCFMLSNMFDPNTPDHFGVDRETQMSWEQEIRDDVIEECNKHGGVLHIYVDKASPQGNVYVKCPSISAAVASVQALHGRWFAGKVITAAYVPLPNYHALFPDAVRATALLMPSTQSIQAAQAAAIGFAPGLSLNGFLQ